MKNRVDLDLRPADRTREPEIERILPLGYDNWPTAGGLMATTGLRSPILEGNEFRILTGASGDSGATTWH